jgi:hypothetical protein
MCASSFYNGGGWYNLEAWQDIGGIPVFWNDWTPRLVGFIYDDEGESQLYEYDGLLILFNECDLPSQCNRSPGAAAAIWNSVRLAAPDALLLGPAPSHVGLDWFAQWLDAHHKSYGTYPEPHRWTTHYYPWKGAAPTFAAHMDGFCAVLTERGLPCEDIWVTEYGTCVVGDMYDLVKSIAHHPAVERFFVFTNRAPPSAPWPHCLAVLDADGRWTPVGAEYHRAMIQE